MRHVLSACAAVLALVSCKDDVAPSADQTPGSVVHPDERYLVREIEPAGTFRISSPIDPGALRTFSIAAPSSPLVTFGKLEGAEHEVLAGVDGFAVDSEARAYVLDAANSVIRVVDRTGAYLTSVGRAGKGPGDLFRPQSIAIDPQGRLLVGDMLRRIQRFQWQSGKLELDTVLSVTASPYAICATDSMIITQGMDATDSSLVQVYTEDGVRRRGFGKVYQSDLPIINMVVGQALLLCRGDRQEIVFASRGFVPDIRVFDLSGRTKKLLVAEDLQTSHVEEFPDGRYTSRIQTGSHILLSMLPVNQNQVLLQYGLITPSARAAGREYETISSVLLDLEANAVRARDTVLPRLVAVTESGVIAVADSTIPQIIWRSVRR